MKRVAVLVSVLLHAALAVALARTQAPPRAARPPARVQVAVREVRKPAPPPPAPPPAPAPTPVHAVKTARAVAGRAPAPSDAQPSPPPPTPAQASSDEAPVAIAGISFESTSSSGSFAVPTGNTLAGAPERVARDPAAARPYRAARFAPASELAEAPQVLNRDAVEIRRYYPRDALQRGREGEVVLRLVIDADGSIAEASVVRDPGDGMGAAALRAVREFRFAPGRVGRSPVATAIPFVIRFVIS